MRQRLWVSPGDGMSAEPGRDATGETRVQALISDIHGNLEALDAVFRDIRGHDVDDIFCLGDIVGYGPDPEACIDVVMAQARWSLMGNHDYALLHGPEGFNPIAAGMIRLTQDRMDAHLADGEEETAFVACTHCGARQVPACLTLTHTPAVRLAFVRQLAERQSQPPVLYVHGSPLDPVFEYVLPDRAGGEWVPDRVRELMAAVPWLAFCGHTHFPCAIASDLACHYPQRGAARLGFDRQRKYIVNVGSVGQPRDGDPRACYALFDEQAGCVEWRRVAYDIAACSRKIDALCGPGNWCARRLAQGR